MTSSADIRICLLVPHYNHERAIGPLLDRLAPLGLPCIVVDDGSSTHAKDVLRASASRHPWVRVVWRETNGGQGAAKRTGYHAALADGYTHSIELDADGQHDVGDIPRFAELVHEHPTAAILGRPVFGDDVPKARLWGRQFSRGLVWAACASFAVEDPLCGFRALPLADAVRLHNSTHTGDRMSHDPEFAVRLFRAGLPIVTLPTRVSYPTDGVSHFDMLHDNLRLAGTYARLLAELPFEAPSILRNRRRAAQLLEDDAEAARRRRGDA